MPLRNGVNMPAILVANGLGAGLMLLVLFSRYGKQKNCSLDGHLFNNMAWLITCLCFIETYSFWVDGKMFPGARISALISNSLLFLLDIFVAFLWTCYADYKLMEDSRRLRRIYPFVGIPAFLIMFFCGLNLFMPVFFTVDANNIYSRKPMTILVYLMTYCYLIYGAVIVARYRKKVDKYLFMPVVQFLTPIFVGSIIQLMNYGIALIWASTALGMTSLYLNLQQEESYIDILTNLYNRNYLIRYMDQAISRARQGSRIYGILLDINLFKQINDTYGHVEGDRVLRGVGKILRQSVGKETVVARYGGDEFVILLEAKQGDEIDRVKAKIEKNLELYNADHIHPVKISMSWGVAEFNWEDMDRFIRQMDENMYRDKQKSQDITVIGN